MRLQNHEDWFRAAAVVAACGTGMIGVGRAAKWEGVAFLGQILVAPLLILGALAVVIGVPYGIWVRCRERQKK